MKELAYLNKYLWKYKGRLFLGVLFILASNIFVVNMPGIVNEASDKIMEFANENQIPSSMSFTQVAFSLASVYMLFALISGVFLFFTRMTIIVVSRLIEYDLKNEIFDKYQSLSMSFYKRNNTGDLMNRISEDVTKVRMYLGPAIMYTINVTILFVLVISFMIHINPQLTLLVLTPLPIMSFLVYKVSSKINKRSEETQKLQSRLSTFVQEAFSGVRVLKAYNREKYFQQTFEEESYNYQQAALKLAKVNALFIPIIMLLIGLSTVITIYIGGIKTIGNQIDIGDILEFIIYINMLTWPIASIGWVTSLIQRAAASQKRINEFLKQQSDIDLSQCTIDPTPGDIEFKNVSFSYENSKSKTIDNVSFKIPKGKVLAITGKTGSGKSTLANLLLRLFDVDEGEILVNGTNIKNIYLDKLRVSIGYVPQEVFLFSDSIENNIAFGIKDNQATREMIEQAAKDADIYDNISKFEKGFETVIGERGITLSGGQKQRVSIARAIIKKPDILLFDDCLSAVDTNTEEKILHNLKSIMNGKTSIIIGHRISSIKDADHIIVLEDGKIREQGSHQQLIDLNGYYAQTYEKQLLEEKS